MVIYSIIGILLVLIRISNSTEATAAAANDKYPIQTTQENSFQISPIFTNKCLAYGGFPITLKLIECQTKPSASVMSYLVKKIRSNPQLQWQMKRSTIISPSASATTIYERTFIVQTFSNPPRHLFLCAGEKTDKKQTKAKAKLFSNEFRVVEESQFTNVADCLWNVRFDQIESQSQSEESQESDTNNRIFQFQISYRHLASVEHLREQCSIRLPLLSEAEYCMYFVQNGIHNQNKACVDAFLGLGPLRFSFAACVRYEDQRNRIAQALNVRPMNFGSGSGSGEHRFTITNLDNYYFWNWWDSKHLAFVFTNNYQIQFNIDVDQLKLVQFNFVDPKTDTLVTNERQVTPLLLFLYAQFRFQFGADGGFKRFLISSTPKTVVQGAKVIIDVVQPGRHLKINHVVDDGFNPPVTALDLLLKLRHIFEPSRATPTLFIETIVRGVDKLVGSDMSKLDAFIEEIQNKKTYHALTAADKLQLDKKRV